MASAPAPRAPKNAQAPVVNVAKPIPIPQLVQELDDWLLQLKRSYAGYQKLQQAYASYQKIPGVPKTGLPIFEFAAGKIAGREGEKCCVDLQHLDPQYVDHVMVPIINLLAGEMIEAAAEIKLRAGAVPVSIQAMLQMTSPKDTPALEEPEENEDDSAE